MLGISMERYFLLDIYNNLIVSNLVATSRAAIIHVTVSNGGYITSSAQSKLLSFRPSNGLALSLIRCVVNSYFPSIELYIDF
jgi:hypothetical protein